MGSSFIYDFATVALAVTICLSTIFNLGGIIVLQRRKNKQFVHIVLISMLASNFLGAGLGCSVELFSILKISKDLLQTQAYCDMAALSMQTTAIASIYHVTMLCVHRYLLFMRPIFARDLNRKHKKALLAISLAWLMSLVLSLPPVLKWGRYRPMGELNLCSVDFNQDSMGARAYQFILFYMAYTIPLAMAIIIFSIVWKHSKRLGEEKQRKFIIAEMGMFAAFVITWTPYAIVCLMSMLSINVPVYAEITCSLFAKTSTVYNSVIYFVTYHMNKLGFCCKNQAKIQIAVNNGGNNGELLSSAANSPQCRSPIFRSRSPCVRGHTTFKNNSHLEVSHLEVVDTKI